MSALPRALTPAESALLVRVVRANGPVSEWDLDYAALNGLRELGLVGRVEAYKAQLVIATVAGFDAAQAIAPEYDEE